MASNVEEPMEVESITKLPLPKQDGKSDNDPDVAYLTVSVWSPDGIPPKKFKSDLTKTLQSWANKNSIKGEFTAIDVSEDGKMAVISVTPAAALQDLLNLSGKDLSTKEKKIFRITPIEQNQNDKKSSGERATAQNDSVESVDKDLSDDVDSEKPCLLALGPYWYMKNFYPDKIQSIERENGVRIVENVGVTIKSAKKTANLKKAEDEFTQLTQMCLDESPSLPIPLKKVGPEEWIQTLKFLKMTDRKCQIIISSDEITIYGPQQYKVAISKSLQSNISANGDQERMVYNERGSTMITTNFTDLDKLETKKEKDWERDSIRRSVHTYSKDHKSPERVRFVTSIKDPFVSDGLPLEDIYWDMIKSHHQRELNRIKEKFNVSFREEGTKRDKKVVKAHYNRVARNMSMESHAIRALLRLYQKVAMSHLRPTNGSFDEGEQDLFRTSNKANGATGKEKGEDKSSKDLTEDDVNQRPRGAEAKKDEKEEECCPVCMDSFTKKSTLKCKHEFCEDCLKECIKTRGAICPVCKDVFGEIEGDQPDGTMRWHNSRMSLPGFDHCGTIEINYDIPSGTQTAKHPNPGQHYRGAFRTAYLPDNKEGNEVLKLLKRAFDQRLIFTVGTSRTSGEDNSVTWNDIHHKTSTHGGSERFGYPDPTYLSRVKEELKAKGIK